MSRTGRLAVTFGAEGLEYRLSVWDVAAERELARIVVPGAPVAMRFSPDETAIFGVLRSTLDGSAAVATWPVDGTGHDTVWLHTEPDVAGVAMSRDSLVVAFRKETSGLAVFDVQTRVARHQTTAERFDRVAISPNGGLIATITAGRIDAYLRKGGSAGWDRDVASSTGYGPVRSMDCSETMIVAASESSVTVVYGPGQGVVSTTRDKIHRIALNSSNSVLAVAHESGVILVDPVRRSFIEEIPTSSPVERLAFSLGDRYLVTAHADNVARIWDVQSDEDSGAGASKRELGLIAELAGKPDEAEDWYSQAYDAGDRSVADALARLSERAGRPDDARQWRDRANEPDAVSVPPSPDGVAGQFTADEAGHDDQPVRSADPRRPVPRPRLLAGATADTVPEPGEGRVKAADRLGTAADVEMLVSVLLAVDTPLPLAVGLFGDWGSGKSFFMALMQERIDELAGLAAKGRPEGSPFCRAVSQVRFNAWHYVDTNLWASLATTLFDQLALPSAPDVAQAKLTELDEARTKVAQARATRQHLELEVGRLAARASRPAAVVRASVPAAIRAVRADPNLMTTLRGLASADGSGDYSTERLVAALGQFQSTAAKARATWQLFAEEVLHRRRWPTLVTLVVLVGALGFLAATANWPAGLKVLTLAGAVAAGLTPALNGAIRVLHLARDAREARELPLAMKQDDLARARAEEEVAEQAAAQHEQELADLRDSGLQLRKFVRERAASTDYRDKLGVISRVRQDFEQLVTLLQVRKHQAADQAAAVVTTAIKQVPDVERIVLYIDDLDRCPHDKVVEVLQAVHLLMAFKLFVVVVGVDSRWLERSLAAHYRELLEQPGDYLEKIFQIPYTLQRMTLATYQNLIGTLAPPAELLVGSRQPAGGDGPASGAGVARPAPSGIPAPNGAAAAAGQPGATGPGVTSPAAQRDPGAAGSAAGTARAQAPAPDAGDAQPAEQRAAAQQEEEHQPAGQPEAEQHEAAESQAEPMLPRPEALVISAAERELLGLIGRIVPTPRAAKRLVNIYRMLRVSVADAELEAFLPGEESEYQAALLLLGVLVGRPSSAHKLFASLISAADDVDVWTVLARFEDVYAALEPVRDSISVVAIAPYRRWIPRVSRFSFRLEAVLAMDRSSR
jgi:hypothetical protein